MWENKLELEQYNFMLLISDDVKDNISDSWVVKDFETKFTKKPFFPLIIYLSRSLVAFVITGVPHEIDSETLVGKPEFVILLLFLKRIEKSALEILFFASKLFTFPWKIILLLRISNILNL